MLKYKSRFMIQDYPKLIKYFASVNPLHLFLYVMPVIFFINMELDRTLNQLSVLGFLAGVLYWTFLEYAIHRWAYHTHFKNKFLVYFLGSFHAYHHSDMSDHRILNSGFLMITMITPTVLLPFLLFFNYSIVLSMGLGLASAYYIYECVHYLIHYREYKTGYMAYIQKYHLHHHDFAPHKNFGNSSHLWDIIFQTISPRYIDYKMSEKTRKTLITFKQKSEKLPEEKIDLPIGVLNQDYQNTSQETSLQ
jgi:sterol desaturase/sphingolipid hydroxylase (fatty acid hydroxylase superfamily)